MVTPLPADRLFIEPWEHAALLDLERRLDAGEVRLEMTSCADRGEGVCLGAYVATYAPRPMRPFLYTAFLRSRSLRPLFSPGLCDVRAYFAHPGWQADAGQGAQAIRAFLAGEGDRCWDFMREVVHG